MPKCIDYARAESDDVVRKKFRRRVVWFVVATVVVIGIGLGWGLSWSSQEWSVGKTRRLNLSGESSHGWIWIYGPARGGSPGFVTGLRPNYQYSNGILGIDVNTYLLAGWPKWIIAIRYRTLFLLATIPWLITLIRLIRIWRVKHVARIGQ